MEMADVLGIDYGTLDEGVTDHKPYFAKERKAHHIQGLNPEQMERRRTPVSPKYGWGAHFDCSRMLKASRLFLGRSHRRQNCFQPSAQPAFSFVQPRRSLASFVSFCVFFLV